MRSLWLWVACIVTGVFGQSWLHYQPDQPTEVQAPPPSCDAGSYIQAVCVNHHVTVALSAAHSENYDTLAWSVNHPGVHLTSTTSINPLLKVDADSPICDGKILVTLFVRNKRGEKAKCTVEVGVSDTLKPEFTTRVKDQKVDCDDIPSPAYVGAKDDCDKHIDVVFKETETTSHGQSVIRRTWTATDRCGNTNKMSQMITVTDKEAPTLVGVEDHILVECGNVPKPCVVVAYDNCDDEVEVDMVEKTVKGTCVDQYKIIRTWSANDDAYNVASETQTITVKDLIPPTIGGGVANAVFYCDTVPDKDDSGVTAFDNCDEDVVLHVQERKESEICPHAYTLIRTWTAIDNCGNSVDFVETLVVQAREPTLIGVEDTVELNCDDDIPLCEPDFDDPCDYGITLDLTETTVDGTCEDEYTIYRTWTTTNVCGNSASISQTIIVTDDGAPKFTTHPPPSRTVSCDNIPSYGISAVDDCDENVYVNPTSTNTGIGLYMSHNYEIYRSWTAQDNCGNTDVMYQTIVVADSTPPTIFGVPPDLTVECDSIPGADANTVSVNEECECEHLDVDYDETRIDGTCEHEFTLIREWKVTDCSGNPASASQTIHVRDTIKPHLIAKEGTEMISIEDLPGVQYFTDANAYDNCDPDITVDVEDVETVPLTCSHNFQLLHCFSATDLCGNTVRKCYTIIVNDKIPPVLVGLPGAYQVWECDDPRLGDYSTDPVLNGSAVTATDNSFLGGGTYNPLVVYFNKEVVPGTCDDEYEFHLSWWVADSCNNRADAEITIKVIDYTPPTISTPKPKVVTNDCDVPDGEDLVTVDDNCADVSVIFEEFIDYSTNPCASQFTVYRSWEVVDDCGNKAGPVKQTVYVEDREPPVWIVEPPADTTYECENAQDYAVVPIAIDPNCHDNVTHVGIKLEERRFDEQCEHHYKLRRKWAAQDCLGNFAFSFQTITVVDTTPPRFLTVVNDETEHCLHDPPPVVIATDNCGYDIHVRYFETISSNCPKDYEIFRHWVARDECGNKDDLYQTITVEDREPPVLTFPSDCVASCDEELSSTDASCSDDCSYVDMQFSSHKIEGDCPHNYKVVRSWTCTDDCGKQDWGTQTVSVTDFDPPQFDTYVPAHITVECDEITRPPYTLGGSDNCGYPITGLFEKKEEGIYGLRDRYDIIRTWILKDTCGNSVLYEQTVHVDDFTPPVLHNIPVDETLPCQSVSYWDSVWATDNCGTPTITKWDERVNTTCEYTYTIIRHWQACDECNLCTEETQVIYVNDHEKPLFLPFKPSFHFTTPSVTVSNIGYIIPEPIPYDNCDLIVFPDCTTTREPGCTDDDYTLTRICTATDECGNMGYAVTQIIEVEDREPCPFLTVPLDIEVDCDTDLADIYDAPTHECEYMIMSESLVGQTCADEAIIVKTWTITDECGNTNQTVQTITVVDNEDPVFDYLSDVEDECEYPLETYVLMSDNCDPSPTQTYKEVQKYYNGPHDYLVTQQWFVKDRCGNSKYRERDITVKDRTPPTLGEIPADETVDHQSIPGYPDYVPCEDNCPNGYTSQTYKEVKKDGTCPEEFTLLRTWCCVDSVGLEDCRTQSIEVEDERPPEFYSCPPDYTQMNPGHAIPFDNLEAGDAYGDKASVTKTQTTGYSNYLYSMIYHRTWVAEDSCENKATCEQRIYITEEPPILCVPDNITLKCEDIDNIQDVDTVTAEIQECSGEGMEITLESEVVIPGTCEYDYCIVRKWRALDNLKGSTSHAEEYDTSQTICVYDNHAPTWDFPAYRTVDCTKAHLLPDYLNIHPVIAEDDCGSATVTQCCWSSTGDYGYHWDYTATDSCGHSVTDRMFVQVVDMEDPVLSDKPPNKEVNCTLPASPEANGTPITCTDNCGTPTLTTWEVVLEQECAHRMRVVRGWRCIDDKGNYAEHEQTIVVRDDEGPTWDDEMPKSMTLECDEELPLPPTPTATDNCGYVGYVTYLGETHDAPNKVTYATEILTIVRKWQVYDDCGFSADWTQSIQIYDTEFPTLIGVPESGEIYQCDACLCSSVTAVDNCGNPSMHSWNVTETGTCPTEKTVITYWEAMDDVGHSVHDSHTLIIKDSNPPEFIGLDYGDIEVDCHEVPPAPTGVVAIDDCDPHVTVVYKEDLIKSAYWVQAELFASMRGEDSSSGYVEYDLYRTWTATDSCGHHIMKTQTISVNDDSPPVFVKTPRDATYDCYDVPGYETLNIYATDNCAPHLYETYDEITIPGTCPGEYKLVRTWTARDNKDNEASHVQTVTVEDNDGPTFAYVPLKKVYVPCEDWPTPIPTTVTATDDCGEATVDRVDGGGPLSCQDEGRYTRTWTATDECGNTRSFEQIILVSDNNKPYCVECPDAYTSIDCAATVVKPAIEWKDDCSEVTSGDVPSVSDGTCDQEKVHVWVYTAEDDCGNTMSHTASVRVTDTTPPEFHDLPVDKTYECDVPLTLPEWLAEATAIDDCDPNPEITHTYEVVMGTCPYEKEFIYLFVATDDCGNRASEYRTITVEDNEAPTFENVPVSETVECEGTVADFNVIATDNCGGVFGYSAPYETVIPGSCADEKKVVYEWSVTDQCGNTASEDTTVTWEDVLPPVFHYTAGGGKFPCDGIPAVPVVTATDNCDNLPKITYEKVGEITYEFCYEVITHKWEACDVCGNCDTHEVVFDIYDPDTPTMSHVSDTTATCKDIPAPPIVVCSDACDPHPELTFTQKTNDGTCDDEYVIERTWECKDNCGKHDFRIQYVTVSDKQDPVWSFAATKDVTIECHESVPIAQVEATDFCDYNVDIDENCYSSNDKCNNVTVCTWVATDNCGNSISRVASTTIVDTTKPVLSDYPGHVKILCDEVNSYQGSVEEYTQFWPGEITATDNCEYGVTVKFGLDRNDGTCEDEYNMILSWRAEDDCGNAEEHKMTVQVYDDIPPLWSETPESYTINAYEQYHTLKSTILDTVAVDNCDDHPVITGREDKMYRQYNRECDNEFVVVRTLTAEDDCGNAIYHTYTISAIDQQPPTLPEIEDITVECDEYDGYSNCEVVPTSEGDEDLEVHLSAETIQKDGYYIVVKTWTVIDCALHTATEVQTITVQDTNAPVLSRYPEDTTVSCSCEDFPAVAVIKAYDNCDAVTVDYTEYTQDGTCDDEYTLIRVWTVTDSADNTESHEQRITVYDDEAPGFCGEDGYGGDREYSVHDDLTVDCDKIPPVLAPDAHDDCDDNPTVNMIEEFAVGDDDDCPNDYFVVREWEAVDACGNQDSIVSTVFVQDNVAPSLSVDITYCLFPNYGTEWGIWGEYDVSAYFSGEDNCEGDVSVSEYKCNSTDPTTNPRPNANYLEECYVQAFGSVKKLFVQINKDPSPNAIGRTYNIYARLTDDCDNSRMVKRTIFVAHDQFVLDHKQPCGSGPVTYRNVPPNIL